MSASSCSAGNVIEVVDPFDLEGYLVVSFDEREVSSVIVYFREIDDFAVIKYRGFLS
jgi:hypothetical protein